MHHLDRSAHAAMLHTARARPQAEYVRAAQYRARQRESRLYTAAYCLLASCAAFIVCGAAFAMTL